MVGDDLSERPRGQQHLRSAGGDVAGDARPGPPRPWARPAAASRATPAWADAGPGSRWCGPACPRRTPAARSSGRGPLGEDLRQQIVLALGAGEVVDARHAAPLPADAMLGGARSHPAQRGVAVHGGAARTRWRRRDHGWTVHTDLNVADRVDGRLEVGGRPGTTWVHPGIGRIGEPLGVTGKPGARHCRQRGSDAGHVQADGA